MTKNVLKNLALVQSVTVISFLLASVIDTAVTGQYFGVTEVAAAGFITPLFLVLSAIALLVGTGISLCCSRFLSKGEFKESNRYFTAGIMFVAAIAVIFVVFGLIFSDGIINFLGANENPTIHRIAKEYYYGIIIGVPLALFTPVLAPELQIDGKSRRALFSVIVLAIVDVTLDFLNVYVFKLGMFGMGLATSLGHLTSFAVAIPHFLTKASVFKLDFSDFRLSRSAQVIKSGLPVAIQQGGVAAVTITINLIILKVSGSLYVAAFSIISILTQLGRACGNGIANATVNVTGVYAGENNKETLKDILKGAARYSIEWNIAVTIIYLALAGFLPKAFVSDQNTIVVASRGLRIISLSYILFSLTYSYRSYLQGLGYVKTAMILTAIDAYAFPALCAYIGSGVMGSDGIWMSFIAAGLLMIVALAVYIRIRAGHFPKNWDDILVLPESFGQGEIARWSYTIRTLEDVMVASKEAAAFCKEKGVGDKIAFNIGLFIEEMATNFVLHGKKDGDLLEIAVVLNSEGWEIRLRDNGKPFSPQKYYEAREDGDISKNIGIRIVLKMAKDVRYLNTFKLNNLVIKV